MPFCIFGKIFTNKYRQTVKWDLTVLKTPSTHGSRDRSIIAEKMKFSCNFNEKRRPLPGDSKKQTVGSDLLMVVYKVWKRHVASLYRKPPLQSS